MLKQSSFVFVRFGSCALLSTTMQLGCQFWGQSYSPCLDDATSQECFNFQAENGERDASETNTPQNPTEAELLAPGDTENPSLDGMDTTSLLDPAEQEVGNTPSVPTEDPGEVILSINEISLGAQAFIEVFNAGSITAEAGSFDIVTARGTVDLNRRCISSFALPAYQVMVFVLGDDSCQRAPTGVPCQVCNIDLDIGSGATMVYLYEEGTRELDQKEYPGLDGGGPSLGLGRSSIPDGSNEVLVKKVTFGLCNDPSSSCVDFEPTEMQE